MTHFTNCDGTATLHMSGPLPKTRKTRNSSKENLVHEIFSHARGVLLRKFRALGGGPDLSSVAVPS